MNSTAHEPASPSPPGRARRLAGWFTAVLVVTWALSSLWYPFGWDQGILSWMGREILDGAMPYRDSFDLKGPAAYYIYALAQALFGENLWGIRMLDLLALGAVAWLVARYIDYSCAPGTGRWAAALLVLWYAGLTFWHTAQPDGFVASLLGLGLLPMLRKGPAAGIPHALLAGLAVGLASAIKPNYAVFLLVPWVFFLGYFRHDRGGLVLRVLVSGCAAVLVVASFIGWFALRGALADLWEVHIAYNATTYSSGNTLALEPRLRGTFEYILTGKMFVVLLPAMLLGIVHLHRSHPVETRTLVTWSVLAFAGVVLQNKFFDYQWAPFLPPAVLLASTGLYHAIHVPVPGTVGTASPARSWQPRLGHALFLVILIHASIHPLFEVANWGSYMAGLRDRNAYYDTFGVPGDDLRMVQHIESVADRDDRLLVMAWNTEILYMSGLDTVSRFGFSLPFWMGEGSAEQALYRAELMQALHERAPEFIVVGEQALPLVGRQVSLDDFPAFRDFLRNDYRPEVRYGDLELYRLQRAPQSDSGD